MNDMRFGDNVTNMRYFMEVAFAWTFERGSRRRVSLYSLEMVCVIVVREQTHRTYVVFERGVRAWCSSVKRENTLHRSLESPRIIHLRESHSNHSSTKKSLESFIYEKVTRILAYDSLILSRENHLCYLQLSREKSLEYLHTRILLRNT